MSIVTEVSWDEDGKCERRGTLDRAPQPDHPILRWYSPAGYPVGAMWGTEVKVHEPRLPQ